VHQLSELVAGKKTEQL